MVKAKKSCERKIVEAHIWKSGKEDMQSAIHNLIAGRSVVARTLRESIIETEKCKHAICNPQLLKEWCGREIAEKQLQMGELRNENFGNGFVEIFTMEITL